MSKKFLFIVSVLLVLILVGCIFNESIGSEQMGIKLDSGNITGIVGAGLYTELNTFAELIVIDVSNRRVEWTDTQGMVTLDRQPISLSLSINYRRPRDTDALTTLWQNFNAEMRDNAVLDATLVSLVPNLAKTASAQFSIWQMVGTEDLDEGQLAEIARNTGLTESTLTGLGRDLLSTIIEQLLMRELSSQGLPLVIIGVSITNIEPSEDFLAIMEERALVEQERALVIEQRSVAEERLASEEIETQIQLERAERARQVAEINARTYADSPELLVLRLAEIYAGAIDEGDVIFVPAGTDISTILGMSGTLTVPEVMAMAEEVRAEEAAAVATPDPSVNVGTGN